MTDDLVARLPTDAAARRLPEFIKTLRIKRAARRESVYASDNVYALLDALDAAEARARELEAQLADQRAMSKYNREQAEKAERALAEAYERAAKVADGWLAQFANHEIKYVSARMYASDAIQDIATAIRKLTQEVKHEAE